MLFSSFTFLFDTYTQYRHKNKIILNCISNPHMKITLEFIKEFSYKVCVCVVYYEKTCRLFSVNNEKSDRDRATNFFVFHICEVVVVRSILNKKKKMRS